MRHIIHRTMNVTLIQTGFDKFTIVYGQSVKSNLDYTRAALEFGASVMHSLACEGQLDNRSRSEALKDGDSTPQFATQELLDLNNDVTTKLALAVS